MDKLFGKYRAKIVNPNRVLKPGFVRVEIPSVSYSLNEEKYPWAEIQLYGANDFNEGSFIPFKVGQPVWVEFIQGDRNFPLVTGSCMFSPEGIFQGPHDAFGGVSSLDGLHMNPMDGEAVDSDYEETKESVQGRAVAFTKEGWGFRIQNGALTCTHLKTLSRFEFSESGHFDLYTTENGFIRAKNKLKIWAAELLLKISKTVKLEVPTLEQKIQYWTLKSNIFQVNSDTVKFNAKAIQFTADSDMNFTAQGRQTFSANGASTTKISQNLITAPTKAWGGELTNNGAPLAEVGIESVLGKLILENLQGSLKGQLDAICDQMLAIIDEVKDAVHDTGVGQDKVSLGTVSKLLKLKPQVAQLKVQNALIFK